MTDRQLRKLSRRDLLELLLNQSRELSEVKQALEEANAQLESRRIAVSECGSIAEAALKLNGVFEAAQEAANHYLVNMGIPRDAGSVAFSEAETLAAEIISNAEQECQAMLEEARLACEEMLSKTEESCRHMQYEALRRDLQQAGKL